MDTLTPRYDETEFADVIALLRATYAVRAEDIAGIEARTSLQPRPSRRRRTRWWSSVAAAVLIALGVTGIVALQRRGSEPVTGPTVTGPTVTTPAVSGGSTPELPATVPVTTADGPADSTATPVAGEGDEQIQWFLPTIPESYTLYSLGASTMCVLDAPNCGEGRLQNVRGELVHVDSATSVTFSVSTATGPQESLDDEGAERRVVDGVEYLVWEHSVTWVVDDWHFSVDSWEDGDLAMTVATTLRSVSSDEARAAVRVATDHVLSLPTVATGTFADGTHVSLHLEEWRLAEAAAVDADTRAAGYPLNRAAICIERAEPICLRHHPVRGEEDPGIFEVFDIDGQRRVIGWSHQAMDGLDAEGRPVETVAATSGSGTFLSVLIAPEEELPRITWNDERGWLAMFAPHEWILP